MEATILCPVCEKHFFNQPGDYDICPICDWENDIVQFEDHDYWGGANDLTVNEAKIYYKISLCEGKAAHLDEIQAEHDKRIGEIHSKYKNTDYRIHGGKIREEFRKEHDDYMSQIIALFMK